MVRDLTGSHAASRHTVLLSLALIVLGAGTAVAVGETPEDPVAADAAGDADRDTWFDAGHARLMDSATDLAQWTDAFFGEPQSDIESAESRLRIRFVPSWDQERGQDFEIKLRGKLHLPAAERRLSLLFEDDETAEGGDFESAELSTDQSRSVALQYTVFEHLRQRIDLAVGAKSGPKGKLSARYRNEWLLSKAARLRVTEELFYVGGDGFGVLTRMDLDRVLDEGRLLRWANRGLYAQESQGLEWSTRLGLRERIDSRSAARAFIEAAGETDPHHEVRRYTVGAAYRRNVLRPWLFVEVEPRYEWRQDLIEGRIEASRQGVAVLLLRLEVALEERSVPDRD
jgi:hypothetical protein